MKQSKSKKTYTVPYGRTFLSFELPESWNVTELSAAPAQPLADPLRAVSDAFKKTDGIPASPGGRHAAVALNDQTRPVPCRLILPPLLEWIKDQGYTKITLLIANGTHPPSDLTHIPDDILNRFSVLQHDAENSPVTDLGKTSEGTPCQINSVFAKADLKIVTGNIEPHQFMGWSGGVKSAVIGLASKKTIQANHAMLSRQGAAPCRFEDNPVRQDVEEMGRMTGVDLALNLVVSPQKEIAGVFAGPPETVMKQGIDCARGLFTASVERKADLVIASAGGFPKDINLYQAQKALRNAAGAARPGAPVILTAACTDGIGSRSYEQWMHGKTSFSQVRTIFDSEPFRLGPHKAMLFAADADGRDVYLVSELAPETVRGLLLKPADSVQQALDMIDFRGGPPDVCIMGGGVVPVC